MTDCSVHSFIAGTAMADRLVYINYTDTFVGIYNWYFLG